MPQSVAEDMFHTTARALCQHPDEPQTLTAVRTRQMVHATLALDPRDGLEMMLATLVVGHHGLILDSIKDVHQTQDERTKIRAKSGIVALDRALLGLLREYRLARARPTAAEAADARPTEPAPAEPPPAETAPSEPAQEQPATETAPPRQPAPPFPRPGPATFQAEVAVLQEMIGRALADPVPQSG